MQVRPGTAFYRERIRGLARPYFSPHTLRLTPQAPRPAASTRIPCMNATNRTDDNRNALPVVERGRRLGRKTQPTPTFHDSKEVLCADPACFLCSGASVCGRLPAQPRPPPPAAVPAIPVSRPVQREVSDYEDFTGQTDAVQVVDIRARVTGYLNETLFKEGSEVNKGDLLFVDRPAALPGPARPGRRPRSPPTEASFELAKSVYDRATSRLPPAPSAENRSRRTAAMAKWPRPGSKPPWPARKSTS